MAPHGHTNMRFAILSALLGAALADAAPPTKNGFALEPLLVPVAEIRHGGPPRDGIPAINYPRFSAADAAGLDPSERVLGVATDQVPRAYPVRILDWHEVVNDRTEATPLVITYCPLCGSGMAFLAADDTFGVSGLLYNSDVLLYDRATESLWSQILGRAIAGPRAGADLVQTPVVHGTWQQWRGMHPETRVLAPPHGYRDDYSEAPPGYRAYERSRRLWQPVAHRDRRFHPKTWVLGITLNGVAKAYPFPALEGAGSRFEDTIGDARVIIRYEGGTAWAEDAAGGRLPAVRLFWFAWYAFHPETLVFERN